MDATLSIIGIVLGLAIIMVCVWKGWGVTIASLLAAAVVIVFSGLDFIEVINGNWLPSAGNFVKNYFVMFALGALFGKLMQKSGAAQDIADTFFHLFGERYCIYGAQVTAVVLIYGGVSGFVSIFTLYPIFLWCCRKANLPRSILPGMIYGSVCTFACSALPGNANFTNLMPIPYLGTTASAAPVVGLLSALACMIMIFLYWEYVFRKCRREGIGFDPTPAIEKQIAEFENRPQSKNRWMAFIPFVVLLVSLNVFKLNVLYCLMLGSLSVLILYWKKIDNKKQTLIEGMGSSVGALMNTAIVAAFGGVIQATAGYVVIRDSLMNLFPNQPLWSLAIATTFLCGVCGSGSAGMNFALESLSPTYLAMGVNPEIMHRVIAIAGIGLDSLPHCGMVTTFIDYCGQTHKSSYKHVFVVSVVCTLAMLAVACILGSIFYPFGG